MVGRKRHWTVYLGGVLALFVPALVIAQAVPGNFVEGEQLTATKLNQVLAALRSAVTTANNAQSTAESLRSSQCRMIVTEAGSNNQCQSASVCLLACPVGTFIVGGGCDVNGGGSVFESMPTHTSPTFPASGVTLQQGAWTGWNCEATAGVTNMAAYAICCP